MSLNSRLLLNSLFLLIFFSCVAIYKLKNNIFSGSNTIVGENLRLSRETEAAKTDEVVTVFLNDIMKAPVSLNQDDPILINKIRKRYLVPPSKEPYNLVGETDDPSKGQSEQIRILLNEKRNGFFIECGALDGETRSNSLVFEKKYGWEGVLIEGDPKNFRLVLEKNRKAWTVPACLSTLGYPNAVMFKQHFNIGKISDVPVGSEKHKAGLVEVQCLPIYSILLALNRTNVDYFSLDVEGHEVEVLQTIPWDKVNITTLSVEFSNGKLGKKGLMSFMISKGYVLFKEVTSPGELANDFIFFNPYLLNLGKK